MKVSELMNPRVAKVGPKTPLTEVLQLMLRAHLNDVLVVDQDDSLLGIVTTETSVADCFRPTRSSSTTRST